MPEPGVVHGRHSVRRGQKAWQSCLGELDRRRVANQIAGPNWPVVWVVKKPGDREPLDDLAVELQCLSARDRNVFSSRFRLANAARSLSSAL